MDKIEYSNVINCLLDVLPEFQEIYERMLGSSGEIFPYVLIGSGLVKFTLKNYELFVDGDIKAADILNRLIDFLEACALSSDEDVTELIRVGFMEHLDTNHDSFDELTALLKPESKKLLKEAKNI